MIPPIDPATLAMLTSSGGGAQGVINSYAANPMQSLTPESIGLLSDAAQNGPQMSSVDQTNPFTGQVTTPVSLQNANEVIAEATGGPTASAQAAPQMPKDVLGGLGAAFDSMAAKPSDFGPITAASRSGFSQQMPDMQTNPYGSAAANKGLLELLQGAYSLGV